MQYNLRSSGLVAIGVLAVLGCADADRTNLFPDGTSDWQNLERHENAAVVGEAGAIIVAGGAAITIPKGALAEPVEISVQQVQTGYPEARGLASEQMFAFLPHGTQFLEPVTITIPHDHGDDQDLALYTSEPNVAWSLVPGARFSSDYASAEVNHFSFFFASPITLDQLEPGGGGQGGAGSGGAGSGGAAGSISNQGGSSDGGSS